MLKNARIGSFALSVPGWPGLGLRFLWFRRTGRRPVITGNLAAGRRRAHGRRIVPNGV